MFHAIECVAAGLWVDMVLTRFIFVYFQPVGVGFSHGDTPPINETQVAEDFFAFFQNWLGVFEDYQHKKVWITGESYAGECAWFGVCWQQ